MKWEEASRKLENLCSFMDRESLRRMTVADRLNYMRVEMWMEGWLDYAESDPMRSSKLIGRFREVLEIVRRRKEQHEQFGKKF